MTVVPETEVVIPVEPVKVNVPLVVIAVPDPLSAAAVMLVTVPAPAEIATSAAAVILPCWSMVSWATLVSSP